VNRIVSVFPPHQHRQIRLQLAGVLRAVISQRLMPRSDAPGRCPAVEVMVMTPFIRDCIIDPDRTVHIHAAIAAGASQYGMQTFDQSVYEHYRAGRVTYEEALRWASRVDEFKMRVQGISIGSDTSHLIDTAPDNGPSNIIQYGG
jgi:twitching motility protein PilT